MRVESDGRTNEQLPAHVVKASLHRSKPWASSYWLDRYNNNNNNKEGIEEGLRYKPKKSGRKTPHIPLEVSARIRG